MRRTIMAAFKMRPRPRKPTEPQTITFEVGGFVTLGYFLECVEQFKTENPDRSPREIMLNIEEKDWGCPRWTIVLEAPPQSQAAYEKKLEEYKIEFKAYKMWQKAHEKEIDKHKIKAKKATAKRKLKRTQERLKKEMAAIEAKLEKV
jgi:hypothetical protein